MTDEFNIKINNLVCDYRLFGRCKNPNNKYSDKSVYIVERNSPCNKESCPIAITE